MKRSALAIGAIVSLAVVAGLTGCAPAVHPHHSSAASRTPSFHTAAPTATPGSTAAAGPGPLPANALLRITATVTAPGGAAADLVQTVYQPTAITAAQKTELTAACPDIDDDETDAPWLNNYATALILTSTMTATLHPGSPAWANSANPVLSNFMALGDFSGAYNPFEADCAPGFIAIPGTEHAIAPIQATDPAGQNFGWAGEFASYGFYGGGNDPTENEDLGGAAVVSNCTIELSATAAANSVAAGWAAAAPGYKLIDGCGFDGAQLP
jgi:hypothetical protein